MNAYYSDVIQFKGSHYEFGYMQGKLLQESPILPRRKEQWFSGKRHRLHIDKQEAIDLLSTYLPSMLDEIQGLADALNWEMEEALVYFGGYYIDPERSGCSILTGSDYMIRNYDSHPAYYEGRYLMFEPTDRGYASIGPSMQITGRTDGMNEKGLAMGYNFINRVGFGDGFICNMIGRIVLETCGTVHEGVSLLKEIPHRTSFIYTLVDPSGETFVVEASPREVIARKANSSTNHFEVLMEENRYRMDDSIRRKNELEKEENIDLQAYPAYQLLNDAEGNIFSNQYDASSGTIHTAAYLPREKKALFAIGGNRKPVVFDFDRYLKGEKTNIKQIRGVLDFGKPFVNME